MPQDTELGIKTSFITCHLLLLVLSDLMVYRGIFAKYEKVMTLSVLTENKQRIKEHQREKSQPFSVSNPTDPLV